MPLSKSLTEIYGQVSVKCFIGDEERESDLLLTDVHTLRLRTMASL